MIFLIFFMIILGILFGSCMFYYYRKTIIKYHGPNSNKVKKTIHKDKKTGKCYMFEPHVYLCPML
jgi:hypothetical protein